eukprot:TRINITY_DN4661_c0_g1_i1.p1 TRINITY_DN4661_c0_g1~~TRINITY_DN4661_c0_g1_i1.p1  ORF type:complete len:869 (+),score=460.48 TRINITY_DN4661_c0_g1_i1:61-2667(+)
MGFGINAKLPDAFRLANAGDDDDEVAGASVAVRGDGFLGFDGKCYFAYDNVLHEVRKADPSVSRLAFDGEKVAFNGKPVELAEATLKVGGQAFDATPALLSVLQLPSDRSKSMKSYDVDVLSTYLKINTAFGGDCPKAANAAAASKPATFVTADEMLGKIAASGIAEANLEHHDEALTVEAWTPLHAQFTGPASVLTRCLFMKDKKKQIFLLVTLATTKTDMKVFAKAAGAKEPRFANEELLWEKLQVKKGAVNPFAIVNNLEGDVQLYLDEGLANHKDSLVAFHPQDNTKTVRITVEQLQAFFAANGKEVKVAKVDADGDAAAPAAEKPKPKKEKPEKKEKPQQKPKPKKEVKEGTGKNAEGMYAKKDDDFATWYTQVIQKADLIEYYDVSGCYILRPNAMGIWVEIQDFFAKKIAAMGVEPCYFPCFVSKKALCKEESHVEGFAAEVAWVTKSGSSDLEEPIAVRPTSETVMYPAYAKWIRSYRDLPLKLNQWCNVVRWEFSHPTPFIRTREFLWQEGHTAHETAEEANVEVLQILDLYRQVYEDLLAVPVCKGKKTEKEKFAGGDYTTTVEAFIPTVGRSVQGATSHCLGQNFGKMFDITFEDRNKQSQHPVQNSWGMTTRTIGVMIMVHSDDKGLVLPPRVAPTQAVFVPVGWNKNTTQEVKDKTIAKSEELVAVLAAAGVRSKADVRDNVTTGNKCNHWELRGTPIRIEIGPKELEEGKAVVAIRYTGERVDVPLDNFAANIKDLLENIHSGMLNKAKGVRATRTEMLRAGEWDKFVPTLNEMKMCLVPFCGTEACEDQIKKRSAEISQEIAATADVDVKAPSMGAKTLCVPFEQPEEAVGEKCFRPECDCKAVSWTLFGRSY